MEVIDERTRLKVQPVDRRLFMVSAVWCVVSVQPRDVIAQTADMLVRGALASKQLPSVPPDYFASALPSSAFISSVMQALLNRAAVAPLVLEIYVFPATPATIQSMDRFGVSKAVLLNSAATSVFGPPPPRASDDILIEEVGINGLDGLNQSLRAIGITEGFIDGALFLSLHPRHFRSDALGRSGLLYEHWKPYVLSPSGKVAPMVAAARRAPARRAAEFPGENTTIEKGWYVQLYRAPDGGLRVYRPLHKVE